jgi:hypothetical protein
MNNTSNKTMVNVSSPPETVDINNVNKSNLGIPVFNVASVFNAAKTPKFVERVETLKWVKSILDNEPKKDSENNQIIETKTFDSDSFIMKCDYGNGRDKAPNIFIDRQLGNITCEPRNPYCIYITPLIYAILKSDYNLFMYLLYGKSFSETFIDKNKIIVFPEITDKTKLAKVNTSIHNKEGSNWKPDNRWKNIYDFSKLAIDATTDNERDQIVAIIEEIRNIHVDEYRMRRLYTNENIEDKPDTKLKNIDYQTQYKKWKHIKTLFHHHLNYIFTGDYSSSLFDGVGTNPEPYQSLMFTDEAGNKVIVSDNNKDLFTSDNALSFEEILAKPIENSTVKIDSADGVVEIWTKTYDVVKGRTIYYKSANSTNTDTSSDTNGKGGKRKTRRQKRKQQKRNNRKTGKRKNKSTK